MSVETAARHLRRAMYVAAVVSLICGVAALPFNAVAQHWRLAAFNVGCFAICALVLMDRKQAG